MPVEESPKEFRDKSAYISLLHHATQKNKVIPGTARFQRNRRTMTLVAQFLFQSVAFSLDTSIVKIVKSLFQFFLKHQTYTFAIIVLANRRRFMPGNKYFIKQYSFSEFLHGGIGYVDIEKILLRMGFEPVAFPHHTRFSWTAKISRLFYLLRMFLTIARRSDLVFIYPVFAKMNRLLLRLAQKKGINITCIVADIDGIKDGNSKLLEENITELRRYKNFIAHNNAMRDWLEKNIGGANITTLEFFDFPAKEYEGDRQKSGNIVFAGNLGKSLFIENLHLVTKRSPRLHFNLYGDGYTKKMIEQDGVSYKGAFRAYDLPDRLEGSFGLVWDGDAINEPGGSLGNYMRYITHHKVSLYIVSGLPLIVPEIAASAALVKKYGIGITVRTLFDIHDHIDSITDEQYRQMRINMQPLAKKITSGLCLVTAITDLLKSTGNG